MNIEFIDGNDLSSINKASLSNNTNQNPTGYKILKVKMVGIIIKNSDNIIFLISKQIKYLNVCQQPKRIQSLSIEQFNDFSK